MDITRFMLRLALASGLLALLSLPLGNALSAFFIQALWFCIAGAALLGLGEFVRSVARGWRFFLTGREG